jgi:mannose-6-phosphate isomerase
VLPGLAHKCHLPLLLELHPKLFALPIVPSQLDLAKTSTIVDAMTSVAAPAAQATNGLAPDAQSRVPAPAAPAGAVSTSALPTTTEIAPALADDSSQERPPSSAAAVATPAIGQHAAPPPAPMVPASPDNFDNPLHPYVVPIIPAVKTYAWGMRGPDSAVASLYARCGAGAAVHPETPHAELWIGTHPTTPCKVLTPEFEKSESLKEFVDKQVILVDPGQLNRYADLHNAGLPFLFKILSIAKPLSIQAHPDKTRGAALHEASPELYKDPNHKPELAVALTPFEAMVGFRPFSEIVIDIARVPEFADATVRTAADNFVRAVKSRSAPKQALRGLFASLMSRSPEDIKRALESLVTRFASMSKSDFTPRDHLLLLLNSEFPGDVGCFGAYLFNHVHLKAGQAIFIGSNEPHAYIKGQCVEIMACSDNVVRAGLTPKHKDVDTLVEMLSYNVDPVQIMEGLKLNEFATVYAPPVDEFVLIKYELPAGKSCALESTTAPTVLVVLAGDGFVRINSSEDTDVTHTLPMNSGSAYFLKSDMSFDVSAAAPTYFGSDKAVRPPLIFFRAGTNESAITSGSRCSVM